MTRSRRKKGAGENVPNYWIGAYTEESWNESRVHGMRVAGFHKSRFPTLARFEKGDIIICWVTRVQKVVAALRVTGEAYIANEPRIWSFGPYAARIEVEPVIGLSVEDAPDFREVMKELSFYHEENLSRTWGFLCNSPKHLTENDGLALMSALEGKGG